MANIKKYGISFLLTFTILLSGCQSTENDPQISDNGTSSITQDTVNKEDPISIGPDNSETVADVTENEASADPAETTEKLMELNRDEWIYIEDAFGLVVHYNSIINTDCSKGEMSDIAYALACKNALYVLTYWGTTFETDWDHPVTYGEDGLTLYPAISILFPDVKSIYELAYSTYGVNDEIYTFDADTNSFYSRGRLFFTEIDGKLYVDPNCTVKKGAAPPFGDYTYIEITEQTEDTCKLSWYYYDRDKWGGTDELYSHIYFKRPKAIFVDGAWRLDDVFENTI
ncbi:MAG: hypothetical protein HDT44_00930 [Ruminococcaceae bacterium]|nr:hypothetical protein [Oscillospiraceae bacterium]